MKDFQEDKTEHRNNSPLSYVDCCMRLTDDSREFEDMTDDDLDSIYRVAFGHWPYHSTRQHLIDSLYKRRENLKPIIP